MDPGWPLFPVYVISISFLNDNIYKSILTAMNFTILFLKDVSKSPKKIEVRISNGVEVQHSQKLLLSRSFLTSSSVTGPVLLL